MVPEVQFFVIDDLSKGLNVYDGDTSVPKGFYRDAVNMVLTTKNPITVGGLTKLNTTTAGLNRPIIWFEPYSNEDVENMIVAAFGDGSIWNYDRDADDWTRLYAGLETGDDILWTSVPFRGNLIMTNGVDPVIKYDGVSVTFVGALSIVRFETDESWTGGTIITDPAFVVQGEQAMSIADNETATFTFPEPLDLSAGIGGGPVFGDDDQVRMRLYKPPGSSNGTFGLSFVTSVGNTYDVTVSLTSADDGFTIPVIPRSDFVATGTPDWANITSIGIRVDDVDQPLIFDDIDVGYELRPPVGKFVEMYNQQLVVGGIPGNLTEIRYSDPGTIDFFPEDNFARFSGGRHQMEKTDQITALHTYFDELIVGKVNSAWTFSGSGENVAISALPLTIGIDSHRAMVETPWALHFPFENNVFGARLTSRGIVSQNVNPLIADLDGDEVQRTVAMRHDRSHTVRWSFRTNSAGVDDFDCPENDLGLIYDHQLDAWCCRYTPQIRWYSRAIVNGNREILVAQYDDYIRRADVGTTFDGTAIASSITLPFYESQSPERKGNVSRWVNGTFYLRGTATVSIEARFADEPHEFAAAAYETFGTIGATPDGDKGFVYFGRTSRWFQLRLSATAGSFEVLMPIVIGHLDTGRRV